MTKNKKEINIKLDLSFFTLDNIKEKTKNIKTKLQTIPLIKNTEDKRKYKKIGVTLI
jgi:hypothetical protein